VGGGPWCRGGGRIGLFEPFEPLRLLGLESTLPLNTGPDRLGPFKGRCCASGSGSGAEGDLTDNLLSVDFCLSSLSSSNRAVSFCLSSSFSFSLTSLASASFFLTEVMIVFTISSASSPNTDPASPLSVVGVGGSCIANGDLGVGGPDGSGLMKWMSNGFTHGFALPPGVPGRDPNPGPGALKFGTPKLTTDPLFAPKRVRMFISETCGLRRRLVWLAPGLVPTWLRSNMLAAARL
jgi:hypothetical protein